MTRDYTVYVSEKANGPWTTIKNGTFNYRKNCYEKPGTKGQCNANKTIINTDYCVACKLETFKVDNPVWARFVKFSCETFLGKHCTLEYIGVFSGKSLSRDAASVTFQPHKVFGHDTST